MILGWTRPWILSPEKGTFGVRSAGSCKLKGKQKAQEAFLSFPLKLSLWMTWLKNDLFSNFILKKFQGYKIVFYSQRNRDPRERRNGGRTDKGQKNHQGFQKTTTKGKTFYYYGKSVFLNLSSLIRRKLSWRKWTLNLEGKANQIYESKEINNNKSNAV